MTSVIKPETLNDMRDASDGSQSSEEDDGQNGLSDGMLYLSYDYILLLQTLKTFAILFAVLSVINLPILYFYSGRGFSLASYTFGNLKDTYEICADNRID